jgi:hypothetical protein
MDQAKAKKIWLDAVERVKDRTMAPVLWRALESGVGVTAEDDVFVVGFPPTDSPMSGYLTSSDHRITIEKVLTEIFGKTTRLKVIEGTSLEDYEGAKQREKVAEETRRVTSDRKRIERAAERQWEVVSEQCSRKYANTPLRQLPQVRARFLFDAIQIISDSIDSIHPDGNMDEIAHRALARVIEKVATLADVPGAVVGVELLKVRKEKAEHAG